MRGGEVARWRGGEVATVTSQRTAKRLTICVVRGHDWAKVPYPESDGHTFFLRCMRCWHASHMASNNFGGYPAAPY